jgi:hypothetical protein
MIRSRCSVRSHCNCIANTDVYWSNRRLTLRIVDFDDHLDKFSWHVSIFLEQNVSAWNTLTDTTATGNLSSRCLLLTLDHSRLSQNNLSWKFDFLIFCHTFNCNCHVINDNTLFTRCNVTEWCWPSFKCLETEWETVLSSSESIALINQHSVLCEHVSCFIIVHFIILISWISNILGSVIVFSVIFRLWIWNNDRSL